MISKNFHRLICDATGATDFFEIEVIQNLWSGYGKIIRLGLKGCDRNSVIVKHVKLPNESNHPRGWNTDLSHQRKIKSYEVETAWYHHWGNSCNENCRIPHCLDAESEANEVLIILEDLDDSGFPVRKNSVSMPEIKICLSWLANFHATFMGQTATDLWEVGTYWHLETRPDELNVLEDQALKMAAEKIDLILTNSPYQTLVHGDAKLANFCFSDSCSSKKGKAVAAVDFQYVGGGCGMKDVIYFISSCLYEEECERLESELLDFYFTELKSALIKKQIPVNPEAVEKNWRELYPVAWTDFHRFLKGWSPNHWKINTYSERLAHQVISQINNK